MKLVKKHRARFFIIIIIFFNFLKIPHLFSQEYKYRLEKLVINNDLFANQIQCVIKDKKGLMWFGTKYGGLYRFDGYNFKSYKPSFNDGESINDYWVTSMCDDENYLWIGTNKGLNRFDKKTEKFKTYFLSSEDIQNKNSSLVWTIYILKNNELWFGMGRDLYYRDKESENFIKYKSYPESSSENTFSNFVRTLCEDKEGFLWIGTYGNGIDRYDPLSKSFKHFTFNPKNPFSLSDNRVSKILEDKNGDIWASTYGGGVSIFNKNSGKFYRFLNDPESLNTIVGNNISAMSKDEDQMIWLGTSEGISIYDIDRKYFTNLKRADDPSSLTKISCIYPDRKGIVWICTTTENGFSIYDKNKWKFNHYRNIRGEKEELSSNEIGSICEDGSGNLWVGSQKGIDVLNIKKERVRHFENIPDDAFSPDNNNISFIYCDAGNNMWVGTRDGPLERYDLAEDKFVHYYDFDNKPLSISNITEDREGNLWIGLDKGGIRVFDKNRTLIKKYLTNELEFRDPNDIRVYKIIESSKGQILTGTDQGLIIIDLKTESISIHKNNPADKNTISSDKVYSIVEDNKGFIWLGVNRGGLNLLDYDTKIFRHFLKEGDQGFSSVSGLLADNDGNLWGVTEKGIVMFNSKSESFTCYGPADGTQGLEFYLDCCYKSKDGEMFFGGSNGFNSFYPDSIFQNKNIPVIVLTDFRIFNKKVKLDTSITEISKITISYDQNFISFHYAALDYTDPAKNQYVYKLEGVDKDWNYVGNVTSANYTDLNPGDYFFRVKGSNNDGLWCTKSAGVTLVITPPWYYTSWFKALIAISLTGGTGFIFLQRIRKTKRKKAQQREFTMKLIQSQENERKRIAGELHDSLGQNLMVIKNKLYFVKDHKEESLILKELDEISGLTSNAIEEVRAISHNLRPYELERLGLTEAILSIIENINASKIINVSSEIENIDNLLSADFEINFFRIIQESMGNILKHSKALSAEIKINRGDRNIETNIKDDGIGFDTENMKNFENGMGLASIQERVNIMNGRFEFESVLYKGTLIKITIPVKQ